MQLNQVEEADVPYPMVDVGQGELDPEANEWNKVVRTLFSNKYEHMLAANKTDDLYSDFLETMMTSPAPVAKSERSTGMMSSFSMPGGRAPNYQIRFGPNLYRKFKKTFYQSVNFMVKDSVTIHAITQKSRTIQTKVCNYKPRKPKHRRCYSHEAVLKFELPVKNYPVYKYQKQRDEVHFIDSMPLKQLQVLVSRLLIEKKGLPSAEVYHPRSRSGELKECGGGVKKLKDKTELPFRQLLKVLHCRDLLKMSKDKKAPWYLDRNPISTNDSLDCLKSLIIKHGCSKEKVILDYLQNTSLGTQPTKNLSPTNQNKEDTKTLMLDLGESLRKKGGHRR